MLTQQEKKEFALQQIKEYIQNPARCAYSKLTQGCRNILLDGRMCVAGKNYLPKILESKEFNSYAVEMIFSVFNDDQTKFFIPESANKLSKQEWAVLQKVHDYIATGDYERIERMLDINDDAVFTFQELMALKNQ